MQVVVNGAGEPADAALSPTSSNVPELVSLSGAQGETLGFALTLSGLDESDFPLALRATPLNPWEDDPAVPRTALGVGRYAFFRIHAFPAPPPPTWAVRYARDQVVELEEVLVPISAPRGGLDGPPAPTVRIWVELSVPQGASPGKYRGALEITGGARRTELSIVLTVWPFALSGLAACPVVLPLDLGSEVLRGEDAAVGALPPVRTLSESLQECVTVGSPRLVAEILDDPRRLGRLVAVARLLQTHGISVFPVGIAPRVAIRADGTADVGWEGFDRLLRSIMEEPSGGDEIASGVRPVPIPGDLFRPEAWAEPLQMRVLQSYFRQVGEHFDRNGWMGTSVFPVGLGGGQGAEQPRNQGMERSGGRNPAEADAGDRLLRALVQSEAGLSALVLDEDLIDLPTSGPGSAAGMENWIRALRSRQAGPVASASPQSERRIWLLAERPPFSASLHPSMAPGGARALAWQAWRLGVDAVWLGEAIAAENEDDSVRGATRAWGGGLKAIVPGLLYTGDIFGLEEPVATLRLKSLFRGRQDVAYLARLKELGRGHISAVVSGAMIRFQGEPGPDLGVASRFRVNWPEEEATWELARQVMADEWKNAVAGSTGGANIEQMTALRWRRLLAQRHGLAVEIEGGRLELAVEEAVTTLQLYVNIWNHSRTPWSGAVSIVDPPTGLAPEAAGAAGHRVEGLGVGEGRAVLLSMRMAWVPALPGGRLPLTVLTRGDDGIETRTQAEVGIVAAAELRHPLRVDGDLNEWTEGGGNVLDGFALVGAGGAVKPGGRVDDLQTRLASSRVLTVRDDEALYVAWEVSTPENEPRPVMQARVHQTGLEENVPRGDDDAIQILIYPPNTSVSWGDASLRHLAVRRNGQLEIWIGGKGVDGPAPLFAGNGVSLATRDTRAGWSGELRIPFALLEDGGWGEGGRGPKIWGFNVVSYDAGARALTAWSGAAGDPYRPSAFGNLLLP